MFRFPTVIIVSTTLVLEHLSHLVGISTSTKIYYPFNQKREKYYPISIDLAPKESEKSQGFHTDRYSTTMWSGGRRQGKNGPAGTRKCSPDDSDRTVQAARGRRQSLAPHMEYVCAFACSDRHVTRAGTRGWRLPPFPRVWWWFASQVTAPHSAANVRTHEHGVVHRHHRRRRRRADLTRNSKEATNKLGLKLVT
jgi:hypothetical protein